MRIVSYIYSQLAETLISATSENPNFRASNIKHEHRSKEWRSGGSFLIQAHNNTLVIDHGGVQTLTLTPGRYSADELCDEVNQQIAGAGVPGEVSYAENSGLWTIQNPSGAIYKGESTFLPVIGFNSIDLDDILIEGAVPAIHTEEHITFDFKTTEPIDTVVLLWGKKAFKLSTGASVRVQASATSAFENPPFDQEIDIDNQGELGSLYLSEAISYRYWRIVIEDPQNPNLFVNIGSVIIGKSDSLDPDNGFEFTEVDNTEVTRTDFGHEYGDEFPIMKQLNFNMTMIEYSEAKKISEIFRRVGTSRPIFVVMDPDDLVFDSNHLNIYGKLGSTLPLRQGFYNIFETGLSVREVN